jgi:hypothetical protein
MLFISVVKDNFLCGYKNVDIKCVDCGCLLEEWRLSQSPKYCPNRTWKEECCCWINTVSKKFTYNSAALHR